MISPTGSGDSDQPRPPRRGGRIGGFLAGLLLLLAKLKTVFLLLTGLPILGSAFTLLLSAAVYGAAFGWGFGIGFVLLLLVHELGHYFAIRSQGLPASLPIFIPFMGAAIFLRARPQAPQQEYFIAAAGPIAGTLGSLFCWGLGYLLHQPLLSVLAYMGFILQAFNLIPVWPLDGGRMVAAVDRRIWWIGIPALAAIIFLLHSAVALIIGIVILWQFFGRRRGSSPDIPVPPGFRMLAGLGWLGLLAINGVCAFLILH